MSPMCKSHNLGPRFRRNHLRIGVVWLGLALGLGFALVEWGLASRLGFLLVAPLTIGTYSLLAGSFGICVYSGVSGKRHADHGAEGVPDPELRQRLMQRGLTLAGVSCTLAAVATTLFVSSI
jgi:hypothetical protein